MGKAVKGLGTEFLMPGKVPLLPKSSTTTAHESEGLAVCRCCTCCPHTLVPLEPTAGCKGPQTGRTLEIVRHRLWHGWRWDSRAGGALMDSSTTCTPKPLVTTTTLDGTGLLFNWKLMHSQALVTHHVRLPSKLPMTNITKNSMDHRR